MNVVATNTILSLISLKQGFGPSFFKKNLFSFKNLRTEDVKENILFFLDINRKKVENNLIDSAIEHTETMIDDCSKLGIKILGINDENYPKLLLELKDAPPTIFYRGDIELINNVISIIGTRKPNKTGELIAERVGSYFSAKGFAICNGLAEGIDEFAIRNHKDEYFNNVIGVLGGGLNFQNNKTLLKNVAKHAEKVLENNGLLISEVLPNYKEDTYSVIKSCRIQAGLAKCLILIQSSVQGGSKFAIKSFAELERTLAVINPLKQDYDTESYNSNKLLIEKNIAGLSDMTELKPEKIKLREVVVLRSKDDYVKIEEKIQNNFN